MRGMDMGNDAGEETVDGFPEGICDGVCIRKSYCPHSNSSELSLLICKTVEQVIFRLPSDLNILQIYSFSHAIKQ